MNLQECPQEATVLAALAHGAVSADLNRHLDSCAICQDARFVWSYLNDQAYFEAQADVPSPGIIWWRAQLAKQRTAAKRSVAAIKAMQIIAVAITVLGLVALGIWESPKLIESSPLLLAGTAGILVVFIASVIVVFASGRDQHRRTSPPGM